jgi:SAM-dependent methyltransferase
MKIFQTLKSFLRRASLPPKDTLPVAQSTVRKAFAAYLSGRGIELGALNAPLNVSGIASIQTLQYVDRYHKADLLNLFPELRSVEDEIVETDITCDIIEGLSPFDSDSLDFVIACHLVEHIPDPIFFLKEVWRVLKVGGRCYLAVPDKDYLVYDAKRPLTTIDHLVSDHRKAIRSVEDHHLEEFLTLSEGLGLPQDPKAKAAVFEQHRRRSIHIHVWNTQTFSRFLLHFIQEYLPFRLVDVSIPSQNERAEMLFILEKASETSIGNLFHPGLARLAALGGAIERPSQR